MRNAQRQLTGGSQILPGVRIVLVLRQTITKNTHNNLCACKITSEIDTVQKSII